LKARYFPSGNLIWSMHWDQLLASLSGNRISLIFAWVVTRHEANRWGTVSICQMTCATGLALLSLRYVTGHLGSGPFSPYLLSIRVPSQSSRYRARKGRASLTPRHSNGPYHTVPDCVFADSQPTLGPRRYGVARKNR